LRQEVILLSVELAPFTAPHDVLRVGDRCGPVEALSESFPDKCSRTGVVTKGAGMYFLQQLVTLFPKDAPHEYAGGPVLVEFAVDEDESFCSAGDSPGFRLVEREPPLDKPLEDGESPVGIFEVHLWWLINRHDFGL
jgi:hypothetical protein